MGELELPRGNAAEGYAFQLLFRCKPQAGLIAVCKLAAVGFCQPSRNNGAYRMYDIIAGQVKCRGNFCPASWLLMALPFHNPMARQTKQDAADAIGAVISGQM